jgi:GMP synthase (glutamine-hydrolysing)
MQWWVERRGGKVKRNEKKEFGPAIVTLKGNNLLWDKLERKQEVWMSHGDTVIELPECMEELGYSERGTLAAVKDKELPFLGLQFHPEVEHTKKGKEILSNFLEKFANLKPDWVLEDFISSVIADLKGRVKEGEYVLSAISGGVDSTTTAVLLHHAIGDRLLPLFIDTGLLRKNEQEHILAYLEPLGMKVFTISAQERFFQELKGVIEPEEKRLKIGALFSSIFREFCDYLYQKEKKRITYLAQGTLYPDVIESGVSVSRIASRIKSHHNVAGLNINLPLLEPLKELFKDEVREIAKKLNIPKELIYNHPFPGVGLAVRIVGEVTKERVKLVQEADVILKEELIRANLWTQLWQAFCILLGDLRSTGIKGDTRCYEATLVIRAVESKDGMTANWAYLPYDILERITKRIINEIPGINRVVYDITTKPPATIEWQ